MIPASQALPRRWPSAQAMAAIPNAVDVMSEQAMVPNIQMQPLAAARQAAGTPAPARNRSARRAMANTSRPAASAETTQPARKPSPTSGSTAAIRTG